jgi:hypothetical protein
VAFTAVKLSRHDDPYPQYRFGLLPEPLTAPPPAVEDDAPTAARPGAIPFGSEKA